MVRTLKVVLLYVLLITLSIFTSACARTAFAEEVEQVEAPVVVDSNMVTNEKLDKVIEKLTDVSDYAKIEKDEYVKKQAEEAAKANEPPQEDETVTLLRDISTQLSTVAGNTASPVPTEAVPVKAANGISLVAYGNVSPTGTYANYATGILPKVAWGEDYVFLSVTNSEYYMIWGDLTIDGAVITGDDCHFARWYYSNQQVGTLLQTGTANVRVDGGGYTMLTSLGDYPVLGDGSEILRKEVGFYAVVAACLFSLRFVWSFVVRLRGAVSVG